MSLSEDGTTNTILGLLAKGDMNCAGRAISGSLFDEEVEPGSENTVTLDPTQATTGTGTQPAAQTTAQPAANAEEEEEEKAPEPHKPTKFSRFFGSLKKFGSSIFEPDVNE